VAKRRVARYSKEFRGMAVERWNASNNIDCHRNLVCITGFSASGEINLTLSKRRRVATRELASFSLFRSRATAESLASRLTSGAAPPVALDLIGRIHGHSSSH
jgi:hypothetical protein